MQILNGPTWTVRRPRARREPPAARSRRGSPPQKHDQGDAEGLDALLRLADVAQNASLQQVSGVCWRMHMPGAQASALPVEKSTTSYAGHFIRVACHACKPSSLES